MTYFKTYKVSQCFNSYLEKMTSSENDHVLVIESTIALGYAGAKCVQYALEVMGMEVSNIVTDQISVNVSFEHNDFIKRTADEIEKIYSSFKVNGLHTTFTHIITGFVDDRECMTKIVEIIKDIKKAKPSVIYVCDPVFGDNGKDYFSLTKDVKCVFRDVFIPLADVTTPNQFEAECLSGMRILSQDDAIKAMEIIHNKGPHTVVITSLKIDKEKEDTLVAMASCFKDAQQEVYMIEFPRIDEYLVGTGDLFVGCFTGLLCKSESMKTAFEKAISLCQVVCQRTIKEARERAGRGNQPTPHELDLRLPKCTPFLMDPQIKYSATKIV